MIPTVEQQREQRRLECVSYLTANVGKRMARMPDGTIKIDYVRIINEPEQNPSLPLNNLWPDWLEEMFAKMKANKASV